VNYTEWHVITSNGEEMRAQHLWCATGSAVDVHSDPLLQGLLEHHPIGDIGGLPCLTHDLQWGSLPVHFMGNIAALQLGPDAVNLAGALRGSMRIAPKLLETLGEIRSC